MIQGIKTRGLEKYFLISPVHLSTLSKLKKKKTPTKSSIIAITLPLSHHHNQQLVITMEVQMPRNSVTAPM